MVSCEEMHKIKLQYVLDKNILEKMHDSRMKALEHKYYKMEGEHLEDCAICPKEMRVD